MLRREPSLTHLMLHYINHIQDTGGWKTEALRHMISRMFVSRVKGASVTLQVAAAKCLFLSV